MALLLVCATGAHAAGDVLELKEQPARDTLPPLSEDDLMIEGLPSVEEEAPLRWFFLFGAIDTYPKLETELLLHDMLDPVLQFVAPGYPGTRTFSQMRDEHLLWPPQIAIGRALNDYFSLSIHAGYSAGTVRTNKSQASILLGIPLHVDIELKRTALYVGLDLDCYPWGAVELRDYEGWGERFRAAKPALGTRITWTEAGFDAQVKLGLGPFQSPVKVELDDTWYLPSLNVNVGVDIPINRRNVLAFNAGYNFFWEQEFDFEGMAFTVAWRYFFK